MSDLYRFWVSPIERPFSSSYWSLEPGGSPGAPVPGTLNPIFFDEHGTGNCLFDIAVNTPSLMASSGYTGNLIQDSSSITIGDASFLGGSFVGTGYPVVVNRNLILSEGFSWRGLDSTISVFGDVYCDAGFITDATHMLSFTGLNSQNLHCNGGVLPTIYVDKTTSNQVKAFGDFPIYINGDFTLQDGTFNTNGHDLVTTSVYVPPVPTTTTPAPTTTTTVAPTTTTTAAPSLSGWWKGEDNTVDSITGNDATWATPPISDFEWSGWGSSYNQKVWPDQVNFLPYMYTQPPIYLKDISTGSPTSWRWWAWNYNTGLWNVISTAQNFVWPYSSYMSNWSFPVGSDYVRCEVVGDTNLIVPKIRLTASNANGTSVKEYQMAFSFIIDM